MGSLIGAKISYDWGGMPIEFTQYPPLENTGVSGDTLFRLTVAYDGSGRRISKTRWVKARGDAGWSREHVTHYTGIGTEIRENMPGGTLKDVRVVVNMPVFFRVTLTRLKPRSYIEKDILRLSNGGAILPKQSFGASRQGLGRYGVEDAADAFRGVPLDENGKPTSWSALNPKFEWYLKNHLGSTMLVYGTQWADHENLADVGAPIAAYDYRSFGEQVTLAETADKVTENFTGKEKDVETQLDYFGARYLDPMLGTWISVDPAGFFSSSYLYMGNAYNPLRFTDVDGMWPGDQKDVPSEAARDCLNFYSSKSKNKDVEYFVFVWELENGKFATNTRMFEGTNNSFGEKQIFDAAVNSRPFGAKKAVAGAHLHGGENDKYDSEVFSEEDYSTFVKPLNIDLFLLTPRESFQRMDTDRNVEFLDELPEVNVK